MNAMRSFVTPTMITPAGFVEGAPTNAKSAEPQQQKTDAQAIDDWEDEGGASSHSGQRIVVPELPPTRGNEVKKEAKCT
jgi:hypothetical protein